jgi:hydroxyacylglutathione hydrolase
MDSFEYSVDNHDILIYRSIYTPVMSNMYIVLTNNEAIIVDPHFSAECEELLYRHSIQKVYILLTHEHFDHTTGVNWLKCSFHTVLICHSECAKAIAISKKNNPALVVFLLANQDKIDGGTRYRDFVNSFKPYTCKADKIFKEKEDLIISDLKFHFEPTPGHSPGSSCITLENKIVFTGDTLLKYTPVILRFPESSKQDYETFTLPYLVSLDKNNIVMPGHGEPFLLMETNNI